MISDKQREEWCENPVTIELLKLVNQEAEAISTTPPGVCLQNGDPYKSFQELVRMDEEARMITVMSVTLQGDWGYFEEIDDEE